VAVHLDRHVALFDPHRFSTGHGEERRSRLIVAESVEPFKPRVASPNDDTYGDCRG